MKFHERLKLLREESGLSQKDYAKSIGLEQARYNKWENNKSTPDLDSVIMLARKFNVSTDYLLGVTPYRNQQIQTKANEILESESMSRITASLADLTVELDEEKTKELLEKIGVVFACIKMFAENIGYANKNILYLKSDPDNMQPILHALDVLRNSYLSDDEFSAIGLHQGQVDGAVRELRSFIYNLALYTFDFNQLEKIKKMNRESLWGEG